MEQINVPAEAILGDKLLYIENSVPEISEDYLDELSIAIPESPPESILQAAPAVSHEEDTINDLLARLAPPEIELIKTFTKQGSLRDSELEKLLRPFGAMAGATLDGLNEKSLDVLGRPLAYPEHEQWIVDPEDLKELRYHLLGEEK